MTVRLGLVGAGACAEHVARAAAALPDAELAAVAAPIGADAFAARHDVPFSFKDYRSLIEAVPVDALVIAAPTDVHYDVCIAAADAGLAVICPSPLAVGPAEADLLAALAARGALRLAMLCPEAIALGRALGPRLPGRLRWTRRRRRPQGWRLDPDRAGGGVLMDLGAAAVLALSSWADSEPLVRAAAVDAAVDGGWEPVDREARVVLSLAGTETELLLRWGEAVDGEELCRGDSPAAVPLSLGEECWRQALADALTGCAPSFEAGLRALETVAACYAAAAEGGDVDDHGERPERAIDYWLAGGETQRSGR
ncbi:Inositol 2-dehydrogenase [bacterium HR29]|nr:Inositol 2-dehydrogenase [bacterium HR29]